MDRGSKLVLKATLLTPLRLALGYILGRQSLSQAEVFIAIGCALLMGAGAGVHVVKTLAEIEQEIVERMREQEGGAE